MSRLVVVGPAPPLRGRVGVPSDKSISHRALILAALSAGSCTLRGFSYGEDNVATLRAFSRLGVESSDDGRGTLQVGGVGLGGLRAPTAELDCGNSGTSMRLLCGVLAAQPFVSRLVGDASLSSRPMGRVAEPLRARGARIEGAPHPSRPGVITAPLEIGPLPAGARLSALEYAMPVASAQVKSALLLSGLFASGPTVVREPCLSRDHTERMLQALGIPVARDGLELTLEPPAAPDAIAPFEVDLPGDLSAAAFLLVIAQLVPQSEVCVTGVGLNPTRTGIVDAVRACGGDLVVTEQGATLGEPFGAIVSRCSPLHATTVRGELSVRSIDEIPVAAVLAARAAGTTRFFDVQELRVKESDRIARTVETLAAFGVGARECDTGFEVDGRPEGALRAARIASHGDHRIAMCGALLGLVAAGETVIDDADCIATSFPRFVPTLRELGARVEVA